MLPISFVLHKAYVAVCLIRYSVSRIFSLGAPLLGPLECNRVILDLSKGVIGKVIKYQIVGSLRGSSAFGGTSVKREIE